MRIIIGLLGAFNLAIGLAFMFAPAAPAAAFFIEPFGVQGLATIRADFPGFFIGAAVFALLGAWRAEAAPLNVPLLMLAIAFLGRCVSLGVDGMAPTAVQPMVVEAVMMGLLLLARRAFAK
ncbi:hypothetical protein GCM10007973_16340 [Polymorphobacter multimanifer]|uniref:Uncharacterized membrane-anchored protein YitT (DUF2179 family) n=1 Tax=Polymorphobacter multimanifer TaxID=1070431 RepID=A0A841L9Z5_9SPHN|nr:DUF4345 family protein [Polymorphobacter multimanifer]MBB6228461.1 uncharacterized membrane-anchored protein YitT (DUF2179 family) [Polymorphobacter multimanifer]GGI80587.1 hypothetical protein GCM10007973_16340 [Polymorphobacter multimanifer]